MLIIVDFDLYKTQATERNDVESRQNFLITKGYKKQMNHIGRKLKARRQRTPNRNRIPQRKTPRKGMVFLRMKIKLT